MTGRAVNVRLDDAQAYQLDRITAGGRSASDVIRQALGLYHDMCRQGAELRCAGYAEGTLQVRVIHANDGTALTLLPKVVDVKEA